MARFLELRREADLSGLRTVVLWRQHFAALSGVLPRNKILHVRELPGATLFQLSREYQQAEQWPTLIPYERGSQVEFYVLDKAFQPVPMGVTGELFIGVSNRQRGFAGTRNAPPRPSFPIPLAANGAPGSMPQVSRCGSMPMAAAIPGPLAGAGRHR